MGPSPLCLRANAVNNVQQLVPVRDWSQLYKKIEKQLVPVRDWSQLYSAGLGLVSAILKQPASICTAQEVKGMASGRYIPHALEPLLWGGWLWGQCRLTIETSFLLILTVPFPLLFLKPWIPMLHIIIYPLGHWRRKDPCIHGNVTLPLWTSSTP
jgi:hypothetical protein